MNYLILIILILLLYYLYSIEIIRYKKLCSIKDIEIYDLKYINLPKISSRRKTVISLTTIPKRINNLKFTLASILDVNQRVDKIYLNLPKYSLKGEKYIIPEWLKKIKSVTINWIEKDLGPATKLLPILKKEKKDTIIIVIDDDVIYGSDMINQYVSTFYEREEKNALTIFGNDIKNKKICDEWPTFLSYRPSKFVSMVKGHNSFLVTPEMFPPEVFQYNLAPKECFWVDDIWFSGWLQYNGVKIYSLGFNSKNIPITKLNEKDGLCVTENLTNRNNNTAINFFVNDMGVMF